RMDVPARRLGEQFVEAAGERRRLLLAEQALGFGGQVAFRRRFVGAAGVSEPVGGKAHQPEADEHEEQAEYERADGDFRPGGGHGRGHGHSMASPSRGTPSFYRRPEDRNSHGADASRRARASRSATPRSSAQRSRYASSSRPAFTSRTPVRSYHS